MDIQRGMRGRLDTYFDIRQSLKVTLETAGSSAYDHCCFGVDSQDKLSDDRYMVFFNQIKTPGGEISLNESSGKAEFTAELSKLPSGISKLVFTASIDGSGIMSGILYHKVIISQGSREPLVLTLTGGDFSQEKAIISIELYLKTEWRFAVVARGFNGGLGDLLRSYGGEEAEEPAEPAPAQQNNNTDNNTGSGSSKPKVSLEKKLSKEAPELVSLAKPIMHVIEKKSLSGITAKVALVVDISGSMEIRYGNGTVQEIVNKILPLAVQFDDDGELDFWYYGTKNERRENVTMRNYRQAVPDNWEELMRKLGRGNNEPAVMDEVIAEYAGSDTPAYVIFITDGGVDKTNEIKNRMIRSSSMPIFWQFVGVGGWNYGILQDLDRMKGRVVDNANFFALDDFKSVRNDELYKRLLKEFPSWLKKAKKKHII